MNENNESSAILFKSSNSFAHPANLRCITKLLYGLELVL